MTEWLQWEHVPWSPVHRDAQRHTDTPGDHARIHSPKQDGPEMPNLATDKRCAHFTGYSTAGVHTTWQAGGPYWLCPSYSTITDGL